MIEYLIVSTIVSLISIIINIISDFKLIEEYPDKFENFTLEMLVNDLSEGFILGSSWIISIPILCIKYILFSIIDIISYLLNKGEDE